jgi:hypothetical protein
LPPLGGQVDDHGSWLHASTISVVMRIGPAMSAVDHACGDGDHHLAR